MDSHIVQGPLAGMVDYQAGAVVSKTLVDKPAGTVTLFAFDQGQGLSEHAAPFDALVQVLDGRAEVRIAEALFRVEAGGADRDSGACAARPEGTRALQDAADHDSHLDHSRRMPPAVFCSSATAGIVCAGICSTGSSSGALRPGSPYRCWPCGPAACGEF